MNSKKIGNFISEIRKEKGLTQKELGEKLFVTDKAVSKWERGLSLPDITLLNKLADILDVEVNDILVGKKNTKRKINIEEELDNITKELNRRNRNKIKKIIILIVILLFIIAYITFRNISLGYKVENVIYSHSDRTINLGVPKTSFMFKNNDRSYSYKNLRNSNILENEIKKYLKTLKYSTCNDTIYYYNQKDNFSIINYSVKNHIFYSTISYEVVDNDYCYMKKLSEYSKKLGGARRIHSMNGEISFYEKWDNLLSVSFIDGDMDSKNDTNEFRASFKVRNIKRKNEFSADNYTLENSKGTYEIKDDKLYYYRTDILEQSDDIKIPEVSIFKLEDGNMILTDNYLSNYSKDIILK